MINDDAQPGKAFGLIKTHKDGNPLRLITSCCAAQQLKIVQHSPSFILNLSTRHHVPPFITQHVNALPSKNPRAELKRALS
jgi:hypothetical protein